MSSQSPNGFDPKSHPRWPVLQACITPSWKAKTEKKNGLGLAWQVIRNICSIIIAKCNQIRHRCFGGDWTNNGNEISLAKSRIREINLNLDAGQHNQIQQKIDEVKHTCQMLKTLGADEDSSIINTELQKTIEKVSSCVQKLNTQKEVQEQKSDKVDEQHAKDVPAEPQKDDVVAAPSNEKPAALVDRLVEQTTPIRIKKIEVESIDILISRGDSSLKEGNVPAAIECFEKAAEQGSADAMEKLGDLYLEDSTYDAAKAYYWYYKGSQKDHIPCIKKAAWCFDNSIGINKAKTDELFPGGISNGLYGNAADLGDAEAQNIFGTRLWEGGYGLQAMPLEAIKYFEMAAAQGNIEGMLNLGNVYAKGHRHGVPKIDLSESINWYNKAVQLGSTRAMVRLARIYEKQGNQIESVKWLEEAKSKGNKVAAKKLSQIAKKEAQENKFQLSLREANNGNIAAMNELAYCYYEGIDVEKNDEQALHWFLEATGKGYYPAAMNLVALLEVRGELENTLEWLQEAKKLGNAESSQMIELMEKVIAEKNNPLPAADMDQKVDDEPAKEVTTQITPKIPTQNGFLPLRLLAGLGKTITEVVYNRKWKWKGV